VHFQSIPLLILYAATVKAARSAALQLREIRGEIDGCARGEYLASSMPPATAEIDPLLTSARKSVEFLKLFGNVNFCEFMKVKVQTFRFEI